VGPSIELVQGAASLDALRELCDALRLAAPAEWGWEAADLQWWKRRARSTDEGQVVIRGGGGELVGAVVLTEFPTYCQLDVILAVDAPPDAGRLAWQVARKRARSWTGGELVLVAGADDPRAAGAMAGVGRVQPGEPFVEAWLDASSAPVAAPLPEGLVLHRRAEVAGPVHHLAARNTGDVAERLAACSLYDAALDLFVTAPSGDVCAYGLFWANPVTGVGLVEPMRTETGFEHRGIASHVLASGIAGMVERGCTRLKVSSDGPLYTRRAGFVVGASITSLVVRPTAAATGTAASG
jgi:predicted N-acetyltransferase YhbS